MSSFLWTSSQVIVEYFAEPSNKSPPLRNIQGKNIQSKNIQRKNIRNKNIQRKNIQNKNIQNKNEWIQSL